MNFMREGKAFLLFILCVMILEGCDPEHHASMAHKGTLDLSAWNFKKNGPIALNGEWEVYWDRLLEPDDFLASDFQPSGEYIDLPQSWNESRRRRGLPKLGHATFRLVAVTGEQADTLALRVGEINSAWHIWINGSLFPAYSGVGVSPESERSQPKIVIIQVQPVKSAIELILQVSNYHSHVGGVITPLMLGRENDIRSHESLQMIILALVVGGLFVMGFYHLIIYMFQRKNPSLSLLGFYYILWALNTSASNSSNWMLGIFAPGLSLDILFVIDIISYAMSIPVFVMFLNTLFIARSLRWFVRMSQAISAVFSFFVLVLPIHISGSMVPFFHIYALFAIVFAATILFKIAYRGNKGAVIILYGFIFIALAGINDILHDLQVINTFYLAHMGIFLFSLSQSIALAQDYSHALAKAQSLSEELREALAEKARYELNPHFLFNSLTSIRGAISLDASIARMMISKLSAYCRMVLSPKDSKYIPLGEELERVRVYLDIEKSRFGDGLIISIVTAPSTLDLPVPPMVLQPLVENAIKYGGFDASDNIAMSIRIIKTNSRLILTVSNSGSWIGGNSRETVSTGTGIRNLRERLRSRYGNDFRIDIRENDGCVSVELDVPAEPV